MPRTAGTGMGTDALTVEITSANACAEWEAYVRRHADATLFHTIKWRRAVEEAFGHEAYYLRARRGTRTAGVLPLFLVRSVVAGRLLVSVPYGVYGGALVDDDDAEAAGALLAETQGLARRLGVRQIDIRSKRAVWGEMPTIAERYVTFRKPLPAVEAEVLAGLPRKARAAARQARERYGLREAFGDEYLKTVWSLYTRSMRRLGSPNYPLRFFERLIAQTPGAHVVSVILDGEEAVAGLVSFVYRGTLLPYFAGSVERERVPGTGNLLYVTAMEWGVRQGLETFDFGRSRRGNAGSYEFKRNQGFEATSLEYQCWSPSGGRTVKLTPDNRALGAAVRLWRRLPLVVTRPLGAWVARSIPG